jgi:uncharacterized protein with ParB-like and HNH nuclease domain
MSEIIQDHAVDTWYARDMDEVDDYSIHQYELTSTPNDFNVKTLFDYIDRNPPVIKIPSFQRNYVWDIKRASKLIESLIIGLPVPQIFLYEERRNEFLVIDGQQRLMSIYYFIKGRFPKLEKRTEIRQIIDLEGTLPTSILHNDDFFTKFNLVLPEQIPGQPNQFNKLNYETLGEYQMQFELRPIRSIIVKPTSKQDDDDAIYEIFNRLNSGGMNVEKQEIRMSLYHSNFYMMLNRINMIEQWRKLLGLSTPDLHMKDVEYLLRGFAMLIEGDEYSASSMVKFLNYFSKRAQKFTDEKVAYLERLFHSFLESCSELPSDSFKNLNDQFSITLFESIFAAVCFIPFQTESLVSGRVVYESVRSLRNDEMFRKAAERSTSNRANVRSRLQRAKEIIEVK